MKDVFENKFGQKKVYVDQFIFWLKSDFDDI